MAKARRAKDQEESGGGTQVLEAQNEEQEAAAEEFEPDSPEAFQAKLKESLQVDVEDVGTLRKKVTITVPKDALRGELDKQYSDLIKDAVVPGFRRGRAPRRLVEKRFGQEVGEQVQTKLVSNAYMVAIDKVDLKVLGDPMIWADIKDKKAKEGEAGTVQKLVDMPTALEHMKLPEDGDLTFRCEVEIRPTFDLPELDNIPVERPKLEITEEDVKLEIKRRRAIRGNWTPVLDGEVEANDLLVCNVKMTVDGQEVKTDENLTLGARAQVVDGVLLEDLGEELEGAKVGETRNLEGAVPDDYERAEFRGKTAKFEITVNDIKRMEVPPLDQEFLSANGFDGEDEYREFIKGDMGERIEHEVKRGMRNQVRKYLLENTKLDLPEGLSTRQTARAALRIATELQRQGVPLDEISKQADEVRTTAREQAITELKLYFILDQIAEKMEVEVTEDEINSQIAMMAQAYGKRFDRMRDELAKEGGIEELYLGLRDEKSIDRLLEKANITEKQVKPKTRTRKKGSNAETAENSEAAGSEAAEAKESAGKGRNKKAAKGSAETDEGT